MYTPPPPSSGLLIPFIIRIMSGFDLKNENLMDNQTRTLFYHRLLETFKHAYAKRTVLGDEEFLNKTSLELVGLIEIILKITLYSEIFMFKYLVI